MACCDRGIEQAIAWEFEESERSNMLAISCIKENVLKKNGM
jgi:hypothetical protein